MGNMVQAVTGDRQPQMALPFSVGSLSQATTGTMLNTGITGHSTRVMPSRGSLYGLVGSYSTALTAGTVTLTPLINGTVHTALQVTNAAANAKGVSKLISGRVVTFNQNDTLQIVYTTAGLNSAGGALEVDALVVYESIDL